MGLDIQSKEVIDKISEDLKVQPAMAIPRELMDKIQLVYGVNPEREILVQSGSKATTGSVTIATFRATKNTFLTSVYLNYMHDVVANSTSIQLLVTRKGSVTPTPILRFQKLSLTAASESSVLMLDPPLEVAPGSVLTLSHVFTVGAGTSSGGVTSYEVDPQ